MMINDNWIKLMDSFGFSENVAEYDMLLMFHSETHRAYHNTNHICDCLAKCELNEATKFNPEIHLAFWYHDAIYNPFKKDNELKSAELAETFLKRQSADDDLIQRVNKLIMATLHNYIPTNEVEAYMMDIDVSILGSKDEDYIVYADNIRKEYKLIPWFIYKKKRKEILKMFLDKESLYFTDYFKGRYEEQARINIANEIARL